jgi:Cof subfamily protein (haloacid dehalogenase superfamily)
MNEEKNYKIIFSDLDETLLVNQHVPDFNIESIKKCREKGTKFIVATGRSIELIQEILKEIGTYNLENEYSICYSGGVIIENKNNKILHSKGLNRIISQEIIIFGNKYDVDIMVFTLKSCYFYKVKKDSFELYRKIHQNATFKIFEELNINLINEDEEIIRIIYAKKDMNYLKEIEKEFQKLNINKDLDIFYSSGRYMELNPKGINKGYAIKWLSNYLNIDINDTIAIGDNYNDISMIKEAGLGVCVSSAENDVKKICNYICEKDYFEGAVKELIDKFILKIS